ncbi:MAG: GDSL-type esterase/lipase family protein [Planctomycetota bacterium]
MRFRLSLHLLTVAILGAAPAPAQTPQLTATITFGDSLTDNALLGFPFRFALYGADPIEAVFDQAAPPGANLTNYAVAGSRSDDILGQILRYANRFFAGTQPLATFISFEIGGNDFLSAWDRLAANPPGEDPVADGIVNEVLLNIANDFSLLWLAHPDAHFALWTVPDVSHTPLRWSQRGTVEGRNVRAHLARVNDILRSLNAVPNITVYDAESHVRTVTLTPPLVAGAPLVPPPATGNFADVFADPIHPTAVANALIANEIILGMNATWGLSIPIYAAPELAALARR